MLTLPQIQELTDLAIGCRPYGAPRWDHAGVAAALRKVQHIALAEIMRAVVIAAEDRNLRTPAAIGDLDSHVWRAVHAPSSSPRARPPDRAGLCTTCSQPEAECRRRWADDHEYVSNQEHRADVSRDDPLERSLHLRDLRRLVSSFGQIPAP